MKYTISKGERILINWLIDQLKGVNRTDARLIAKIDEHLELGEVQTAVPVSEVNDVNKFELAELEVSWVLDHIDKEFEKQAILPSLAKYALSVENKFKVVE